MKNISIIIILIFLLFSSIFNNITAQQTIIYKNPEAEYNLAMELFNKEKYAAAQEIFIDISENVKNSQSEIKANADYYSSLCAFELFNYDAEHKIKEFIKKHPENIKAISIDFQLAELQFRRKKYSKALKNFEKVKVDDLNNEEKAEYYFKTGYCYLKVKKYDEANKAFSVIKDEDTKYSAPVNYYYSHLAYINKNYDLALKGFKKLIDDKTFQNIVPYYIIQIYYLQAKYDKLLKIAPGLLKSKTNKKTTEIARLIGESYYRTNDFAKAIPYLEKYQNETRKQITREDNFILGYSYFKTLNYKKAINSFQEIVNQKDSLAQNAYYNLGCCYLKTNKKQFASNSFLSAYEISLDKKIQEDALFNYAKLSIELSYNPYNKAIIALKKYISDYPNSARINEAYTYLYTLFLSTKNYKDAFASIENIKTKSLRLEKAYQKISYYRGIELFNDNNFNESVKLFKKSLKYNFDKSIYAECYYWIGESYYRTSDYKNAIKYYKKLININEASILSFYNTTYYNIGYSYFKTKDYFNARLWFEKFLNNKTKENPEVINDAYLRLGDCFFITKNYQQAIDYYDKAAKLKVIDGDYALYQKAVSLGAKGRNNEKISTLLQLISQYKNSLYVDDAEYEAAVTYLLINDNGKALEYFKKIVNDYPTSGYVKKSLLKIGLIYYNADNNALALQTLKKVVSKYPGTSESKEALVSIRNIYVDMNKVDDFFNYIKNLSFANISNSEQDSITYIAAENQYMNGDCENSVKAFNNYLEKFPEGAFSISANYYKAECEMKNNNLKEALSGYNFVISKPKTKFTENSLLKAADINFKLNDYEAALEDYINLGKIAEYKNDINKSIIGKMKCDFLLKKYKAAILSSQRVLSEEKIPDKTITEAHFTIAKSAFALNDISLAQKEFEITVKRSQGVMGAEAKYNLSLIKYKLGQYKKAEKSAFELIDKYPSYDYWVAKGFILLADVYAKTGNTFQAKQTLQSIIDNYDGPDLIKDAKHKKDAIIEKEKDAKQKKEYNKMKKNNKVNDDDLENELNDVF